MITDDLLIVSPDKVPAAAVQSVQVMVYSKTLNLSPKQCIKLNLKQMFFFPF